jgi:hypothetical protein
VTDPQALPTGGTGTVRWPDGPTADGGRGQTIDGYTCPKGSEAYHRHGYLQMFFNGQRIRVPDGIGRVNANQRTVGPAEFCLYGLHNHDGTGMMHLEPGTAELAVREPELGLWFKIWGMPLQRDLVADMSGPVKVYVKDDGEGLVEYTGDLSILKLISRREITIVVGTPPAAIPTYVWTEN